MAKSSSRHLSDKTQAVFEKVAQKDNNESILHALEHAQQVVDKAGDTSELRQLLDIESAHLRDVLQSKAKLQETVGTLIAGYDALTNSLGGEIDSMKNMTVWESVVGFFSAKSAREMRERRIQEADIEVQLQDLVVQTQAIGQLLSDHMAVLTKEYDQVGSMLVHQQDALEESTDIYEAADKALDLLNLEVSEQRERMSELTGSERAEADRVLQELINKANEETERRNTALSNAQTHELFIENHKIALDSLMRQKAAQRILIDKLRISTENRIIQYAATLESLKTAAQQESAHAIHEIGTEVDEASARTMAAIGAAADRSIVEMLERHSADMQKRRATQAEVARADAEFTRRFAEVAKQFLEENYEQDK